MNALNKATLMSAVVAAGLCAALAAVAQPGGQDRAQDQDRARDQVAERDQQADRDRVADRDRIADRDQDRDRDRDQDGDALQIRDRDRDRVRDRDIYGAELMTEQERKQYRQRLQAAQSDQEWARIRAEHQEQMQARAREQNANLPAPAYGEFMLTVRERERYRQRLDRARDEPARIALRAEHQGAMRTRARELGVELPEPVYGQRLMTDEEALQLRDRLRAAATDQEQSRIMAEHRQQMQQRAREHQVPLDALEGG